MSQIDLWNIEYYTQHNVIVFSLILFQIFLGGGLFL